MLVTHQETRSGQSARAVHLALKSALKKMAEAEKCAVICFGEIMARKLYRDLGYSSINHYAEVELGFSSRRTRDFVALSRKLADLPRLKAEVESGKLGYTAARVIAPIVDRTNEQGWVEYATTHSRRDLEREVKTAKREAAPRGRATSPRNRPHKSTSTSVKTAAELRCKPVEANWHSARRSWPRRSVIAAVSDRENAIQLQFRRPAAGRYWRKPGTSAKGRAAITRATWKSTTRSPDRKEERTSRVT